MFSVSFVAESIHRLLFNTKEVKPPGTAGYFQSEDSLNTHTHTNTQWTDI